MALVIAGASVVVSIALHQLRRWIKGAQFTEDVTAQGKIAVVTGANSGIGFETVRELNLRGATVYMLCRNRNLADEAKMKLTTGGCNPDRLILKNIDLSSLASVENLVVEMRREVGVIDILVNNAGIMHYPNFELTVDGFELTWQTNYLSHYFLTALLLPLLRDSPNGRIVNVSSALHKYADTSDPTIAKDPEHFTKQLAYARSKLAQIMHARQLCHRLRVKDPNGPITINAMHPGICVTNLSRYNSVFLRFPFLRILAWPFHFFLKTARDGAQTVLFLCLSKSVEKVSGKYFGECVEHQPHDKACDIDACVALEQQSIRAVFRQPLSSHV